MEAVLRRLPPPSSVPAAHLPPRLLFRHEQRVPKKGSAACSCSSDGLSLQRQWLRPQQRQRGGDGRGAGSAVVTGAKMKKKKSSKSDADGFLDESEFFFPEAVLLRKKTVEEDGTVLPKFADAEEEMLFEFLNLQQEGGISEERMRHYEVVYLIHENYLPEVDNVISKVQDFIREKRGKIWRLNNWGLRRLAYKIKKAKNANYILMNFELEAKCINDFKSLLDKDERIIRHLVIKRDEAITEDCPPPPEFHTLQGGADEDSDTEYSGDEQSWDDMVESEMGDYNDDDDDGGGGGDDFQDTIIFVDDEDDNDVLHQDAKIQKAKKRVKATS